MILKSKTLKICIWCLLLNVAVFSVSYYILFKVRAKNQYIASVAGEVASASDKESRVSTIKKDAKIEEDNKAALDAHFISADSVADFFNEIESLGKQAHVEVSLGSADFSKDKKQKLMLSFTVLGTYDAVNTFTKLLENFRYEFQEDRVSLNRSSQDLTNPKAPKTIWSGQFEIDLVSFVSK